MATFLLLVCVAAGCGVIGILFMLYGPTSLGIRQVRSSTRGAAIGFSFAPPPAPMPSAFAAEGPALFAPENTMAAFAPESTTAAPAFPSPPAPPFVPVKHSLSTDFSAEEPVREVRIRAKSPSPPPLPPVTPMPPPPLPKAAQVVAIAPAPRLGVSAPSARARHLEPPRRMPPPMPRARAARGSDAPPLPGYATDQQRTMPRELDEFSTAEHTFVD